MMGYFLLFASLAALLLATPTTAQQMLERGQVLSSGDSNFGTGLKLGNRAGTKATITPDSARPQELGSPLMLLPVGRLWKDNSPSANIARLGDRVFIGKTANSYNGNYAHTPSNWLFQGGGGWYAYLPRNAQLWNDSAVGQTGALFSGHTAAGLDLVVPGNPAPSTCCMIPLAVAAFNDNEVHPQPAWLLYGTGGRTKKGANGIAVEFDIFNATDEVVPYRAFTPAQAGVKATNGIAIQAGGEATEPGAFPPLTPGNTSLSPSSTALVIAGNGSTWNRGIIFRNSSISDSRTPTAIEMPGNYRIKWVHDDSDGTDFFISANVGDYSKSMGIHGTSFGTLFQSPDLSKTYAQIAHVPNAVNYPSLFAAERGQPVYYAANGTDANIDIDIQPKGVGALVLPPITLLPSGTPPASNTACRPGQTTWDSGWVYVCVSTNFWKRAQLTSW